MGKIIVENIYAEDLFEWFYNNIMDSGGDGCGAIICDNYQEVAEWFSEWSAFIHGYDLNEYLIKEEENGFLNWHDSNENWIFTNRSDFNWTFDENGEYDQTYIDDSYNYIFIVKKDCVWAGERPKFDRVIRAIS